MNKLSTQKRVQIISLLVEGNSLRATARLTDTSLNTVTKLLVDVGKACISWQDENMREIKARAVQCDEIWSFVHTKDKNLESRKTGVGSVWTWVAIEVETRLVLSWWVGKRSQRSANDFIGDLAGRLQKVSGFAIYSDGLSHYKEAVETYFGASVCYGQLVKRYDHNGYYMYSDRMNISGNLPKERINTSYVERQNLTMRMHMRRFQRQTNAFSKKVENHCYAIALHFQYYNFCKIHKTLRVTPAMEAGISTDIWGVTDLLNLISK